MKAGGENPGRLAAAHERERMLRARYADWNRRDFEQAVKMFHPEAEWHLTGVFPDFIGVLHGHDEIVGFWRQFDEPWEQIALEASEVHSVGEWLVLSVRFRAVGRHGMEVDMAQFHAARFEGDAVIEYRGFPELEQALAFAEGR